MAANPEIVEKVYSEDDFDYTNIEAPIGIKMCALCGKEFKPFGRNRGTQRVCKRTHFIDCLICGKPVKQEIPSLDFVKCTCSKECENKWKSQRTKEVMLEKYGVENVSQVPEIHEKAVVALRAKAKETAQKAKATLEERYGGMGTASPILRKKIEATMQERYGVTNPSKNDEIRKKISEICKSPEYQEKYMATAIANWGVERPSRTKEVQAKMKQTSLERYGVECSLQTEKAKENFRKACLEKYGVENVLQSEYAMQRAREGFIEHMHDHNTKISKLNQAIAEELKNEFGIETEFEFMIGKKSFDFRIKDTNILLEINPSYSHSDLPTHWGDGLDPGYHLMKTEIAEAAGYHCIHVFDWDNLTKIAKMLQPKQTIYARQCELKEVNKRETDEFIEAYHLQGAVNGTKHAYGLYYNDILVEIMTFGKPRYNKKYEWELLRLCSHADYQITGGASKLFNQFLKSVNPQSLISYCDRAKFDGKVYEKLGMTLDHISDPTKVWSKGNEYITHNLLLQRGYDQLFDTNYGKGTSNEQLMVEHGWRSVYDCGQKAFTWEN